MATNTTQTNTQGDLFVCGRIPQDLFVCGRLPQDNENIITGLNRLDPSPNENNPFRDILIRSNSSYSGTDCSVFAQINNKLISLGNVETFSYSIFREKTPVRVLGRSSPKGYTGGPRTIAGSLVFIVFDRHPLTDIVKEMEYNPRRSDSRSTNPVADQIAPVDIFLVFRNEYGHESLIKIYGVEFIQEGQTHSINDLYSENVTQYVARDIDIMINSNDLKEFRDLVFQRKLSGQFVDNYLSSLLEYKQSVEKQINNLSKKILESNISNKNKTRQTSIDNEYYNMKMKELVTEFNTISYQIHNYENNLSGWNAQRGDSILVYDNLKQAPTNIAPGISNSGPEYYAGSARTYSPIVSTPPSEPTSTVDLNYSGNEVPTYG